MPRATRASKAAAANADGITTAPDSDVSKKRAASIDSTEHDSKKPKIQDDQNEPIASFGNAQVAKNLAALDIPLDEGCPLSSYAVHVDSDGLIWDASLK